MVKQDRYCPRCGEDIGDTPHKTDVDCVAALKLTRAEIQDDVVAMRDRVVLERDWRLKYEAALRTLVEAIEVWGESPVVDDRVAWRGVHKALSAAKAALPGGEQVQEEAKGE